MSHLDITNSMSQPHVQLWHQNLNCDFNFERIFLMTPIERSRCGRSLSACRTVDTKHVRVRFKETVGALQTIGALIGKLPRNCRFSKNSVLNLQTAHELST